MRNIHYYNEYSYFMKKNHVNKFYLRKIIIKFSINLLLAWFMQSEHAFFISTKLKQQTYI